MPKTFLLNRGREEMVIYPEKIVHNQRGSTAKTPDLDKPYHLKVNVSTDRQSTASLPGQVDVKVLNVIAPYDTPVGSWARAKFRGEMWDFAKPVTHSDVTKATRHVEFTLRSRNEVAK